VGILDCDSRQVGQCVAGHLDVEREIERHPLNVDRSHD
jgi:hypothetical protein